MGFVVFLQEPGQDCLYEMADKDEPKPGSIENWEKFVGKSDNTFATGTRAFLNTVLTGPARFFPRKNCRTKSSTRIPILSSTLQTSSHYRRVLSKRLCLPDRSK